GDGSPLAAWDRVAVVAAQRAGGWIRAEGPRRRAGADRFRGLRAPGGGDPGRRRSLREPRGCRRRPAPLHLPAALGRDLDPVRGLREGASDERARDGDGARGGGFVLADGG